MSAETPQAVKRSGFVTGVAWVFIALAGFSTLIALVQNLMLALVFPVEEMRAAARSPKGVQAMPWMFRFMMEYFHLLFLAFFVISATTTASAIGLLLRKNWGRLLFIGMMVLGILWNLSSLAMPFLMSSMLPQGPGHPSQAEFHRNFQIMWNIMMVVSVVMGLAVAALLAWIAKRLMSEDIRREFQA